MNATLSTVPNIDRTYGEPLYSTESEIIALRFAADGTLWSIEEAGILAQFSTEGRPLRRTFLSDLETTWAFDASAGMLASASDDLVVWEVSRGLDLFRVPSESWVTALAFSTDRKSLASGHDDGMVRLWDIEGESLTRAWKAHDRPISALAFRANSPLLATAGEDREIRTWNTASGELAKAFRGHSDRIPALAWQPGGDLLVSAGWDTSARLWSMEQADPLMLLNAHADQVHTLTFSSDGRLLACADSEYAIHVWDKLTSGKSAYVLHGHGDEIRCLTFSPDGRFLASAGADRVVHLWDMRTGQLVAGPNPLIRNQIALLETSRVTALLSTANNRLQAFDPDSSKPMWGPPQTGDVRSLAASSDGSLVAMGGPGHEVAVWGTADQRLVGHLPHTRGPISALAFSKDASHLASASASDGLVWIWKIGSPEAILVIPEAADGSTLETVAFHPDGKHIAVGGIDYLSTGGSDGAVCLWNIAERGMILPLSIGVTSLAFDSSGKYLAGGSLEQEVIVWDVPELIAGYAPILEALQAGKSTEEAMANWEPKAIFELPGHQGRIGAVVFSPDGSWLVSASDDATLRVWNVLTGRLLVARQFDAAIHSLTFSRDGKYLYTGNGNTTCYRLEMKKLLND